MTILTATELASVFQVARNSEAHSVWHDKHGAVITQCGKVAVHSTGAIRSGWTASYPNANGGYVCAEYVSHAHCRACRRAC